jgi:hypothetical protein
MGKAVAERGGGGKIIFVFIRVVKLFLTADGRG